MKRPRQNATKHKKVTSTKNYVQALPEAPPAKVFNANDIRELWPPAPAKETR